MLRTVLATRIWLQFLVCSFVILLFTQLQLKTHDLVYKQQVRKRIFAHTGWRLFLFAARGCPCVQVATEEEGISASINITSADLLVSNLQCKEFVV